ncbi:cell wall integrity and stress response component 4-like isoform X2 [Bradysia coprophila]|uniref:cell wall integrity and stress response component 4-like isoform X2 n=1 Tax=Bradysia coprophila TaxID=38358 RepID=UPI00187DA249|nr:cell wall integrity and stress response component 4-like isoform X2 [Bradysia coprophila]
MSTKFPVISYLAHLIVFGGNGVLCQSALTAQDICDDRNAVGTFPNPLDTTCKQYARCFVNGGILYGAFYNCSGTTLFNSDLHLCTVGYDCEPPPSVTSTPSTVPTTSTAIPTSPDTIPTTSTAIPTSPDTIPTTSTAVPTSPDTVPTTSTAIPTSTDTIPTTSTAIPTLPDTTPTTSTAISIQQ